MCEYLDEKEEEEVRLCLRGYPFQCPVLKWLEHVEPYFEEAPPFVDIDDPDFLYALDEICRGCLERLEYERRHRGFVV